MKNFSKIEKMIENWLKPIPKLPKTTTKWISDNVWWIAAIGVVVEGVGILISITGISAISNTYTYLVPGYSTGIIFNYMISIIFMAAILALTAVAINPLKLMQRKGWNMLFLVLLVSAVSVFIDSILTLNIASVILSLVFGAIIWVIGAYLLFEIREDFKKSVKSINKK